MGAARTVEAGPDSVPRIRESLGPDGARGPDVVIEASGAPGQLNTAIELVRSGGTILQVGLPAAAQEVDVHTLVMREISVVTTLAHVCGVDLAGALAILQHTALAEEVLESVHPLEDLPEQLELLATGRLEGKVLFDPAMART
jgi:(R,R)-butanediol dehydrogenase/meso-butanediol dehydrogenase/diacetyl reductase